MAMSTVFREEEHRWCSVTFFSGSGAAEVPTVVHLLLIPAAVLVPYDIRRVVAISKSDNGITSLLPYVLYIWLLESVDASGTYQYPDMWTYRGRVLQSPGPA